MRIAFVAAVFSGCGAKTAIDDTPAEQPVIPSGPEVCDGVDNDLDTEVDEPFRDELGRYIHDEHCGTCGSPCLADEPHVVSAACRDVQGTPFCVATECADGYVPAPTGGCVALADFLCLPCHDAGDCGYAEGASCASLGEELRCTLSCAAGECPSGYSCSDSGICVPPGGSCWCEAGQLFDVACTLLSAEGEECVGFAHCVDGELSECEPYGEVCDGLDNNCNGEVDETFRDGRGAYIDIHNCGRCGVDCTLSPLPEGDLTCGGDPFLPMCVLLCEDTLDGIDPGDRVDADLQFANGCECTVTSPADIPGPIGATGPDLDVNCDGADGVTSESVYVAPDGEDSQPGSHLFPVRTIAAALEIAAASLETDHPRPHVFVAAGTFGETLRVPEGVQIHGGYRRDFLAYDPSTYETVLYTSADSDSPGGAVVVIEEATTLETVVEGLRLHGASAADSSGAAYGVVIVDSSDVVTLRNLTIFSGHSASGRHGENGAAGDPQAPPGSPGSVPREAVENGDHLCRSGDDRNQVAGGVGGSNGCDGTDVSGGAGGSAGCPVFANVQPQGSRGSGPTGGGRGGSGGTDSQGPIVQGPGCHESVCCGLADYTVPSDMSYAADGRNGSPGESGSAGNGCIDHLGAFAGALWEPDDAARGGVGGPGSGGGGGGAGGGAEMVWEPWYPSHCLWPDGLGGGGGGGGAGGCGGEGGTPGTSGAPSIGLLIVYTNGGNVAPPLLEDVTIIVGDGGNGGRGGAGGDGALGGPGGEGGELLRSDRITPPLAGPTPGAHGGAGGQGGPGGGGGGGCGGSSVGVLVWLAGASATRPIQEEYLSETMVTLGSPGEGGQGGGGAQQGGDGADGTADEVIIF